MRKIKAIHNAVSEPIADLVTWRAMPTRSIGMNALDPFIFLNHHGWQTYPPDNHGLPFGPHPHRGFETVTFILEGDLTHKDSGGGESVINQGGVQWMVAGKGLIHAEISSEDFKKKGGPLEILQLWVNLPAQYKMVDPYYEGLQKNQIPIATFDNGRVLAKVIFGEWNAVKAVYKPFTDIHLAEMHFEDHGEVTFRVPTGKNIFCYVVRGEMNIQGESVQHHQLVEFSNEGEEVILRAESPSVLLFGFATPFREPFVAYGPFVMNTEEQIREAYQDYQQGKFGPSII